ncbi:hypothetical protein KFU94_42310 [Chloroflexi bacterium TSY]|nr:hypothetical protein [Chloroflexi bacterium TSY]
MRHSNKDQQSNQRNMALGGILIVLGLIYLLDQLIGNRLGRDLWPFFIIVPDVLVFILALTTDGKGGEALTAVGSVVTATSLLLFYQNVANHFESWAYAWALVASTSIGVGHIVYGVLNDRERMVRDGKRLATIGLAIFLVGAIFFEFIVAISGFGLGLGRFAWSFLLIGAGVFFILRNLWSQSATVESELPVQSTETTQKLSELKKMIESGELSETDYEAQKSE